MCFILFAHHKMLIQASSLLKKTEGVVTLVVCSNPRKDDSGTVEDHKKSDKPKQPEKLSE